MVNSHLPLSLVGANGDVIQFSRWHADYIGMPGARGFGVPPETLALLEGAGEGGTPRNVHVGPRDIDLPITIIGENRGDVLEKQRRLRKALRWRPGTSQPMPKLRFALYAGEIFEIGVTYAGGAETQIGPMGSDTHTTWLLTLRAPKPYWVSVDQLVAFDLSSSGAGRGLLPQLSRLQLSSSQVLGDVTVNNPGDVEAPLDWIITGPGGPLTATYGDDSFIIEAELEAGESRIIDGTLGTIVDEFGDNRYTDLGTAPKFFKLRDGISSINVTFTSATSESRVVGLYRPRRELVY